MAMAGLYVAGFGVQGRPYSILNSSSAALPRIFWAFSTLVMTEGQAGFAHRRRGTRRLRLQADFRHSKMRL